MGNMAKVVLSGNIGMADETTVFVSLLSALRPMGGGYSNTPQKTDQLG